MNDDTTATALRRRLNEARDCMSEVHMTVPDSAIFTSAAKRRTRRGLAVAVTAVCAAIGLTLGLVLPGGSASAVHGVPPGGSARTVHVHLSAWSVDTNSNGTVTVTVHQLTHAAQLQHALAKAGVPAIVTFGKECLNTQNQDALRQAGVGLKVSVHPPGEIITPSQIPQGDKLLFSIIPAVTRSSSGKLTPGSAFGWGLVKAGQPLHCTAMWAEGVYPRSWTR
jgi:hypothetical protein